MAIVDFTLVLVLPVILSTSAESESEHQSSEVLSPFGDSSPEVAPSIGNVRRWPCASTPSIVWVPRSSTCKCAPARLDGNRDEQNDRGAIDRRSDERGALGRE